MDIICSKSEGVAIFNLFVCWGKEMIKVLYPFYLVFLLSLLLDIKDLSEAYHKKRISEKSGKHDLVSDSELAVH